MGPFCLSTADSLLAAGRGSKDVCTGIVQGYTTGGELICLRRRHGDQQLPPLVQPNQRISRVLTNRRRSRRRCRWRGAWLFRIQRCLYLRAKSFQR